MLVLMISIENCLDTGFSIGNSMIFTLIIYRKFVYQHAASIVVTLGVVVSRRDKVCVRYSFFSEVVMVTFESDDETTVVLVDSLVGVMDSLGVFVGFGTKVLSTA